MQSYHIFAMNLLLLSITVTLALSCGEYDLEQKMTQIKMLQCPEYLSQIKVESLFIPKSQGECSIDEFQVFQHQGCLEESPDQIFQFTKLWQYDDPDLPKWDEITFSPPGQIGPIYNPQNDFLIKNCFDPDDPPPINDFKNRCILIMPNIRDDLLGGFQNDNYYIGLSPMPNFPNYNNKPEQNWTNPTTNECEAQQAIELEWNHPIEVTSIEFGVLWGALSNTESFLKRYLDEIQLSYLSDKYEWVVNSEVKKTGLNGSNWSNEIQFKQTIIARGLRIDFVPKWIEEAIDLENSCSYTFAIDLKFKKLRQETKSLFAIMDLDAIVDYESFAQDQNQFTGGNMNVHAGGWRTSDTDNEASSGSCTNTTLTINLPSSSIVEGLVFAKLKPVKIVKSLDINYGNKAIENLGATFTNTFNKGCVTEESLNPDCSPSLIYNYTYPDQRSFIFNLVGDADNTNQVNLNLQIGETQQVICTFNNVTLDNQIWTFPDGFMKFESDQFSLQSNPYTGIPQELFYLNFYITTDKPTQGLFGLFEEGGAYDRQIYMVDGKLRVNFCGDNQEYFDSSFPNLADGVSHRIWINCDANQQCRVNIDGQDQDKFQGNGICFLNNIKEIRIGAAILPDSITLPAGQNQYFNGLMQNIVFRSTQAARRDVVFDQKYLVKDIQWRINSTDANNYVSIYRLKFKNQDGDAWQDYLDELGDVWQNTNLEGSNGEIIRTVLENPPTNPQGTGPFLARSIRIEYLESITKRGCSGFCSGQFDITLEHFTEQGYIQNIKLKYLSNGIWKDYKNGATLSTGLLDTDIFNVTGRVDLDLFEAESLEITILREPMISVSASGVNYGQSEHCMTSGRFDVQVSNLVKVLTDQPQTSCLEYASQNNFNYAVFQDTNLTSCSVSKTIPAVSTSTCQTLENPSFIYTVASQNFEVSNSPLNDEQKILTLNQQSLANQTQIFVKFKNSLDQASHGWSERIEFIKHSQIVIGQLYMPCKIKPIDYSLFSCPSAESSFSYSRFNYNSESEDCKIVPTSTLISVLPNNTYSTEDLDIQFLICNSNETIETQNAFEMRENFICIPRSLLLDNHTLVFWAHILIDSEIQVFLQYQVSSIARSYNTLPQLNLGLQDWQVEIGSDPVTFEQRVFEFDNDTMTFTFSGVEDIQQFATVHEYEQVGQFKKFGVTVDCQNLNESQKGVFGFDLEVDDGFGSVVFNFEIQIKEKIIEQVEDIEMELQSDKQTVFEITEKDLLSNLVMKDNISSFQGFIIEEPERDETQKINLEQYPFKAQIFRTSFLGTIEIEFNTKLKSIDLQNLENSSLELTIHPQDGRDQSEDFDSTSLKFDWSPLSISDKILTIQCEFANPLSISQNQQQDMMKIKFLEVKNQVFEPVDTSFSELQTKELNFKIKRQQKISPASESVSSGSEIGNVALLWCLIASLLLNTILADGGMDYIVQMVRTLQLIVHLSLMNVQLPANVLMINSNLIQIAMFDLLSGDGICEQCEMHQYFSHSEKDEEAELSLQLESLGYQSYNRIANMGSLSLFLILYTFKILFMLLLQVLMYLQCSKSIKKQIKKIWNFLYEETFFNQILSILLESYFEFLLAAYLHIKFTDDQRTIGLEPRTLQSELTDKIDEQRNKFNEYLNFDLHLPYKEEVGTLFTYITLVLLLLVVPALLLNIILTDEITLLTKVQPVYGALFQGIRTRDKTSLSFNILFVTRRALFIFLVLFCSQSSFHLQMVLILNLTMMIYNCSQQRVTNRLVHYQIMFNEGCLSVLHLSICIFTEWTDSETKSQFGWVFIGIQTLMLCGNLPLVIYFGVKKSFIIFKGVNVHSKFYKDKALGLAKEKSKSSMRKAIEKALLKKIQYQTMGAIKAKRQKPRDKRRKDLIPKNKEQTRVHVKQVITSSLIKKDLQLSVISEEQSGSELNQQ